MAAKHKVTQNDLRKFMSLHKQKKLSEGSKKIESPLAKYLEDGSIKCILCESTVRSEALWTVHINAKVHKDNITRRKQIAAFGSVSDSFPRVPTQDSVVENDEHESNGRAISFKRPALPKDQISPPPKKLKSILKNGSAKSDVPEPVVITDDDSDKKAMDVEESSSVLPSQEKDLDVVTAVVTGGLSTNDIPEGFFDNPLLDAKARKVEYRDPVEEEWERFQKEMKEEVSLSTRLIEDESEEATVERQIVEVDEQMKNWSRVVDMEKKKENLDTQLSMAQDVKKEDLSDSSSDEGLDEYVHWRNKQSFR